jgi:putative transposase
MTSFKTPERLGCYVIDDYNIQAIGMEANVSLQAAWINRELKHMNLWCGKPHVICCDNGPEYTSSAIQTCAG